jgi:hypothetical protein
LAVAVTAFAMWAAGYTLIHSAQVTIELVIALVGLVSSTPIAYAWMRRPER